MAAPTNGYATVADFSHYLSLGTLTADSALELEVVDAINAASRDIDNHCRRRFHIDGSASPRRFAPESLTECPVDDIGDATGVLVAVDESDSGSFLSWPSSRWELEPLNGVGSSGEPWPYTELVAVDDYFPTSHRRRGSVQVTARWGWPAVPEPVRQACLIQSARLFRRNSSPEGVAGVNEFGPIRVSKLDPDVTRLLAPYRKVGVLR